MARYAAPSGNITSTGDLFIQINSWTSNFFFVAVTFALFFIMWIRLSFTQSAGRSLVAASFITMIFTVLLRLADLVSTGYMVTFIILTGVGVVWAYVEGTRGSG